MNLLLDTCTLIWLTAEPARLGKKAKKILVGRSNILLLSEASVLEICFKYTSKKLHLPSPPSAWVEAQTQIWGIKIIPISRQAAYRTCELALHHRDPFDRVLIATAIEERATLVTPDEQFSKYPVSVMWD